MKKIYILLFLITTSYFCQAQKTSGEVTLGGLMSAKLDLDSNSSRVTLTLKGPSDRWFAFGLNALSMNSGTDCVVMRSASSFSDDRLIGFQAPVADAVQNWTVTTNEVNGSTRTIVASRAFNTGDTSDYIFNFNLSSLNVIYSFGSGANYNLVYHGGANRGATTLSFTTLGTNDFATVEDVNIYPNPSNGVFNILKNDLTTVSKVRVFDINAKLLKEIDTKNDDAIAVNLSQYATGLYFMEITTANNKMIKKIQKK